MYKQDLPLNNLQLLICRKTKPIKTKLLPSPLWSRVVVPIRALSMGQINLFKNYLYSIGLYEKNKTLMKQLDKKNVNMNNEYNSLTTQNDITWD